MKISREDFRQRLLPILCAQAIGLGCGIAGVKLTSLLVAPTDYGTYGVFAALATIGASVVYAGLGKFISRHWQATADRPGLLSEILRSALRKIPWLMAAALVAVFLVSPVHPVIYGALLLASAFLLTLTQFAQSALQAAREHWRDLGVAGGTSVMRSFAPPLLYATTHGGATALLAGFLCQAAIGTVLGAWSLRRWRRVTPTQGRPRLLTRDYEGPRFVILAVAGWLLAGANRWLVAGFFGTELAGYFTLASNVGAILPSIAGMILLQYVQPQWFATETEGKEARRKLLARVDRVAFFYTAVALALAVTVHLAMPFLIGPLVSERYAAAETFVLVSGFAAVSVTTGLFYHAMLLAAKREQACTIADLPGAALLLAGGIASAAASLTWFKGWLLLSPLVPLLINRSLARRALLGPE